MIADDTIRAQNDEENHENNIDSLVKKFFKEADENNDNKISSDEFVRGVNSMPIIFSLLQCAPEDTNEDEVVKKFDELEVKEARESTNSDGVCENRSHAYVSKSTN